MLMFKGIAKYKRNNLLQLYEYFNFYETQFR